MAGIFKNAVSAIAKSKLAKNVIGNVLPKIVGGIPFVGMAAAGLEFAGNALNKQGNPKGKAVTKAAASNVQQQKTRTIMEGNSQGAQGGAKWFTMEHIKQNWYYYAGGLLLLIGGGWYLFGKKKARRR